MRQSLGLSPITASILSTCNHSLAGIASMWMDMVVEEASAQFLVHVEGEANTYGVNISAEAEEVTGMFHF